MALCSVLATVAIADQEVIETAVSGTGEDDVLLLSSPAAATASIEISDAYEPATTHATGIDALEGDDQITANATLEADATTKIDIDLKASDTLCTALSTGVHAGDGADQVTVNEHLTSRTLADISVGSFLLGTTIDARAWPTESIAQSVGIDGGTGADFLENNNTIETNATAVSDVLKGQINALNLPINLLSDARNTATATATGIVAGTDDIASAIREEISNNGLLDIDASASASTLEVAAELFGAARLDNSTKSEATATGIAGSAQDNIITNTGSIDINADASAESASNELVWQGLALKPLLDLFGTDVGDSSTEATAEAMGISGGIGNDTITNEASSDLFEVYGEAISSSVTLTWELDLETGAAQAPVALAAGLDIAAQPAQPADADEEASFVTAGTRAISTVHGISGDAGNDELSNNAALRSEARAEASAFVFSADISISFESNTPDQIDFPGVTISDISTAAWAVAAGIDGGSGDDTLSNGADLDAIATAEAQSAADSVTVSFDLEGRELGLATTNASSSATALAVGLADSEGVDSISNTGVINAIATSRDDASSVSVTAGGTKTGMVAGVAIADASTTSSAWSFGIDASEAEDIEIVSLGDNISNQGAIQATAQSTAEALSVATTISVALEGVVGGVSTVNGDGTAEAFASGIRSGMGADQISNQGSGLSAVSTATADSVKVAVTISGALEGLAIGASLADSMTQATAHAAGIESGAGNDTVINEADLVSSTTANVASDTVSVTVAVAPKGVSAGFALSNAQTNAEADAAGIRSDDGDDSITNQALVDVDAVATTKTGTLTLNFTEIGAAIADVSSDAKATATGLDGGSGIDAISNAGTVDVTAAATANDTAKTVNFLGEASGDVVSTATSSATGMQNEAGSGDDASIDTMTNDAGGSITVLSHAKVDASSTTIQGGGAAFADTGAKGDAIAYGMSGGMGADALGNTGSIDVTASSEIVADSFVFQLAGVQLGRAGVNATGTAIGLFGDAGANTVTNDATGSIASYASVDTLATSVSVGPLGVNIAVSGVTADALSQGIATGDDVDLIDNAGSLITTAASTGNAGSGSIGLFGFDMAGSLSQATMEGIQAGGGNDVIRNSGILSTGTVQTVDNALAYATSAAVSLDFFANALTTLGAEARTTGIAAGAGDDSIVNSGSIAVGDSDDWMAFGESLAFGGQFVGAAGAYGGSYAKSISNGIDGGAGDNVILNDIDGSIRVDARSFVDAESYSDVSLALGVLAEATATVSSGATGIQAGDGDDTIMNAGTVDTHAYTLAYPHSITDSFGAVGAIRATSKASAWATAVGIDASAGQNDVHNSGAITVQADGDTQVRSDSNADISTTDSEAYSRATARAFGIKAGDGADELYNEGRIVVGADSEPATTRNTVADTDERANVGKKISSNIPIDDINLNESEIGTRSYAEAVGMDGGGGANLLVNEDQIDVTTSAHGQGYAYAESDGYNTDTDVSSLSRATAKGLITGEGDSTMLNRGMLSVKAESVADPYSYSDSREQARADAWARAEAYAYGMVAEGGNSAIINEAGLIDVAAIVETAVRARAWPGWDVSGSARVKAVSSANAVGLEVASGSGNDRNEIANHAALQVQADVRLPEGCNTSNGDCSARADGEDYSTTVVNAEAFATGIRVSHGQNQIDNKGSLTIAATAETFGWAQADKSAVIIAEANAHAWGISAGMGVGSTLGQMINNVDTLAVNAHAFARAYVAGGPDSQNTSVAASARAVGIETGSGDDVITNSGSITVEASYEAIGGGASGAAESIGIDTGDGNDVVWNSGTIISRSGLLSPGLPDVAIRSGGGYDEVYLVEDSRVDGRVELGDGDDLLSFRDNAVVTGTVDGGLGRDRFYIEDRGSVTLQPLTSIEALEVNRGQLIIDGDYSLPADGLLQAEIDDGGNGQLAINGNTGLAGQLSVIALPRIYQDNERFDILTANLIEASSDFDNVNLPTTPLLSFSLVREPQRVEVVTAVSPFAEVARNGLQQSIANQLDRLTATASGDLVTVIGSFQLLAESGYDDAFSSLSPDSHDNYTWATLFAVSQYNEVVSRRLRAQRVGRMEPGAANRQSGLVTDRSLLLAYAGDSSGIGALYADGETTVPAWWRNVWGTAYGQWGDQDGDNGYTGFDYDVKGLALGIDGYVNKRLLLGASAAYSSTDVDQDKDRGDGDIDSWMASLYGSYSPDKAYIDGSVSYGRNSYKAKRKIRVDNIKRTARSDHDGDVVAASLEAGYLKPVNDNVLEPFGRLQYVRLDEDSFTESGAGSINQKISSRDTDSLTSEVGMRVSRIISKVNGRLTADASVAWLHDFDLDDRTITTAYTGSPETSFSIPGQDTEKNGVTLGLGLSFENKKGISTSLNYNGEFRDGYSANGIMGRISFTF